MSDRKALLVDAGGREGRGGVGNCSRINGTGYGPIHQRLDPVSKQRSHF